ncbi:MAG: hypothetical protein JRD94_13540, partial [Deltaproteobacteria bacterium]|nr:hypothetical protein [Deltaproteobacteria bacterium]
MSQRALVPVIVVLVVAPQLLGGVFPWAVAVTCVLAGVAGLLASSQIEIISQKRADATLLDWAIVGALAWTGLQLLPLPSSLVALLVPESVDAWQSNALLYGDSP